MADEDSRPVRRKRPPRDNSAIASADPIEIAMSAQGETGSRGDAARRLLEAHERLAFTQTALAGNELLRARIRTARDFSVALLVLALLVGIAAAFISASRSRAIVIEAFAVPPELAARGLTGEVVAQRFLDRLGTIQRNSDSVRAPRSFANAWSGDLRVQIPSTGVSFAEVSRSLRRWLGNETYVSGEVLRTDAGFTVTVRTSGHEPVQATGTVSDLDPTLLAAAERTFEQQQPYLFAIYIEDLGRTEESLAISQRLARSGDASERAWGYNAWGLRLLRMGRFEEGAARLQAGIRLDPTLAPLHFNLAVLELDRARDGRAPELLAVAAQRYAEAAERRTLKADAVASIRVAIDQIRAHLAADFDASAAHASRLLQLINYTQSHRAGPRLAAISYARLHRPSEARALLATHPLPPDELRLLSQQGSIGELTGEAHYRIAEALEDWPAALRAAETLDRWQTQRGGMDAAKRPLRTWPWIALARARSGDIAGAEALAARLPADCYLCARTRGRVAALGGRQDEAEQWFRRAAAQAPQLPFAYSEWGEARLARRDFDGAATLFRRASEISPRWADPLKHWGDALALRAVSSRDRGGMAEALRLYQEASGRAPRWGALHVEWGRALWYAGRRDEAREKLAAAERMDLSRADRARLERIAALTR
jgi:tetratricopeptide (TPR) repeat protein